MVKGISRCSHTPTMTCFNNSSINMKLCQKLCFVGAMSVILATVCFAIVKPALILYSFSILFLILILIRGYNYWRNKYLLFMLDQCYFINYVSLIFIWILPQSHIMQMFQFGLANAHAYGGTFLFRNALVLHDIQRLTSCFIHVLPALFSFLIRWYPSETSVWWYTDLFDSHATRGLLFWNTNVDWFWLVAAPSLFHLLREVLYYIIIYGIVRPSDEYLDSFRYLHKKKILWRIFWKHIDKRLHLISWIAFNLILSTILLLIAVIAWSNYLFHVTMLIVQTLTLIWNGACYYLDYFPIECRRHLHLEPEKTIISISRNENNNTATTNNNNISSINNNNNQTGTEQITDDVYGSVAASLFSRYPLPEEINAGILSNGHTLADEEKCLPFEGVDTH
ncbi:unnamed protein product [Trichobilharzia szidati]|nr:unnamed protein product [Trichobilharzia szidati]